jgi:phosphoglycolate phosphatase
MAQYYKYVIFDLDGTISNPLEGLKNGFRYALKKMDHTNIDESILDSFIGPPLQDSIKKHFFEEEEKVWETVGHFREYYGEKGLFENVLYEGIPDILNSLKEEGRELHVATYKPQPYAERILEHFQLKHLFSSIHGVAINKKDVSKDVFIGRILENAQGYRKDEAVMIGDTAFDIIAGKKQGIATIGLTYGFGSRRDIEEAQPEHIVHSVAELRALLLGK